MAKGAPPPSETLFITGLPMDIDQAFTKEIFSQYGSVKEVTVLPVAAGKNAAAAFVIMHTVDDAKWIVDNVNGNVPQNLTTPVTVVFATPRDSRPGGKGGKDGKDGKGGGMKGMMNMMSMMMNSWGGWGGNDKGGSKGSPQGVTSSYNKTYSPQYETGKGGKAPSAGFGKGGMGGMGSMGGMGGMGGMGKGPTGGKGTMALSGKNGGLSGKNGCGKNGGGAPNPGRFKTVMCNFFLQGTCNRAAHCTYAHGPHELQR